VVGLVDDDLGPFDGGDVLALGQKDDLVPALGDEPAEQLPVLAGEILVHQKDVHGCRRSGAVIARHPWPRGPERKRRGLWVWDCVRAYMGRNAETCPGNIMTLTTRIAWDDTVLPFQLDRSDIRGRVARLDTTLEQILEQHDYPPEVEALVAEMALLTAMIGQTIKLRWKLSLQVRGDGPIRLIATDFFAPGGWRARAHPRLRQLRCRPAGTGADPFRRPARAISRS
jgi:hypothetical protein